MRDIVEYTSEVLRRAEEKKRARRRRIGTAVSFCVPFALLSAAAALVLRSYTRMPDAAAPQGGESYTDSDFITTETAHTAVYAYVETLDDENVNESALVCGDPEGLAELIESIEGGAGDQSDPATDAPEGPRRRITLTDAEGNISSYLLTGLRLKNNLTGAAYALTAEQYERLLELIGE